jgi:hypothetical protein
MVVKIAAERGAGAQVREEMMTQISIDDGGRGGISIKAGRRRGEGYR